MAVCDAILLGGGVGRRFQVSTGNSVPKQFQILGNLPVYAYALEALQLLPSLRRVVFVVESQSLASVKQTLPLLERRLKFKPLVVAGGNRRQDSVRLGLAALATLDTTPEKVLIHDSCRPYLAKDFLVRIESHLSDSNHLAWVPVVSVTETLKRVENGRVLETVDRRELFRVQTPQIFDYRLIHSLHLRVAESGEEFTDDASLCERFGVSVGTFEGDVRNIKLTYPFEKEILRPLLEKQREEALCELGLDTISTV